MSAPRFIGRKWARLVDETHDWNAEADRVDDLPHFGIIQAEDEGDFPTCELVLPNTDEARAIVAVRPRLLLSIDLHDAAGARVETVLRFDGVLEDDGELDASAEGLVTLRFEARRPDWEARRDAVLATIGLPTADPTAGDLSDPVERLDAYPGFLHWSPFDRLPRLSSIVGSGQAYDVDTRFRRDSLRISREGRPLGAVDVVISAEWTENRLGEWDVGAMVAEAFGELGASTYTPEAMNDWPKLGTDLGSGYVVSRSALRIVPPPAGQTDAMVVQQAATAARTFRPGATQPQEVRLRRTWFDPVLHVTASSQTKRREEVRFRMFNGGQRPSTDVERVEIRLDDLAFDAAVADWQPETHYGGNAVERFAGFLWRSLEPHDSTTSLWIDRRYVDEDGDEKLRWELLANDGSPLGSPAASSFFDTPRGRLAIDHGMLVAAQRIAHSQRSIRIELEVDAMEVLGITCRDTVTVRSDRIRGGVAIGKVRSYEFRISATEATCKLVLAVSTGSGLAGGGGGRNVSAFEEPIFRVAYVPPAYVVPWAPRMGIAGVDVSNGPGTQEQAIVTAAASGQDVVARLREVQTRVAISTLPTGGGESDLPIVVGQVTAFQGFRGISL